MREEIRYLDFSDGHKTKRLLAHIALPASSSRELCVFLNPLYDEKRFAEQFQASLSRELCSAFFTIRFDYYATGASEGGGDAFSLSDALSQINFIITHFLARYPADTVCLAGIRFGADMALHIAAGDPRVKRLLLIEPLVEGKAYLHELQVRRKVLHKWLAMRVPVDVAENGRKYLDHFGYLISEEDQQLINDWNSCGIPVEGKLIHLYTRGASASKALVRKLAEHMQVTNEVHTEELSRTTDFWMYSTEEPLFDELAERVLNCML